MSKLTDMQKKEVHRMIAVVVADKLSIHRDRLIEECLIFPGIGSDVLLAEFMMLVQHNVLASDSTTGNLSPGPRFHALLNPELLTTAAPLLEVDYRIKGVRFTQSEIDQLRYELVPMTDVVDMRHPPSLVRRSYTIKGVEFTQAELARLFSLLVVKGAATQSGGGYQTPHGYPFLYAGQHR